MAGGESERDDPAVRLLERDSCLASVGGWAAEAQAGDGRLVLVAGEAGVGKSALVERLRAGRTADRWTVSACDGLFTPRPLGPLFDIADQVGGGLRDQCNAGAGRAELFRALLHQLGLRGVLDVLVVEDVHWADEATLDLLRYLGRRLHRVRALLIATYRDDSLAADDPLRIVLGDLVRQRATRQVTLEPLSVAAVRELAAGSGLDPAALHRLTGGNPFYVTEVLQAGTAAVPVSARDATLARAAGLPGELRATLDAAALIGNRVEPGLLAAVTGCSPAGIDRLLATGLLVDDGSDLRFRHEIARLVVQDAVAAHRGTGVHRRILAALRDVGCDDDSRMAFHAEAAGDAAAALRHARSAARRAVGLASHREAAAQFQRALRFAGGVGTIERAELYEGLAAELSLLERYEAAADAAERALSSNRSARAPSWPGRTRPPPISGCCTTSPARSIWHDGPRTSATASVPATSSATR